MLSLPHVHEIPQVKNGFMLILMIMKYMLLFMLFPAFAWSQHAIGTMLPPPGLENVHSVALESDSLASSFLIFIKNGIKLHKHEQHSEHVYILNGEATMQLGNKTFTVRRGDLVFIPKGVAHKVTVQSEEPLKVLSVQSPFFDGKDRILLE